ASSTESGSAMRASEWQLLARFDRNAVRAARIEAHYAVQWLARAARAYIEPRPDDSHTNLGWDDALQGFMTHPFSDRCRLRLKITDLSLQLISGGAAQPRTLALAGRRDADVRQWLGERVSAEGLDPNALDTASPYEIPPHAIREG